MSLKVAIFEDDRDLAEALKERLSLIAIEAINCYNLRDDEWREVDVVVADFRNQIVRFDSLRKECQSEGIPLLAISGAEMDYRPQIPKPFTTDELKNGIFEALVHARENGLIRKKRPKPSLLATLSAWFKT
jgi:hypothetical protein